MRVKVNKVTNLISIEIKYHAINNALYFDFEHVTKLINYLELTVTDKMRIIISLILHISSIRLLNSAILIKYS